MAANQTATLTFKVEGMSCNHCKMSIENAVRALDGVTGATVSLAENEVAISYDPAGVRREDLENAIKAAGYKVTG
jgi:copper chaperone